MHAGGLHCEYDVVNVMCQEEVELRAATVIATERIAALLNAMPSDSTTARRAFAIHIDWLLWQDGEARKDSLPPHHRTLTCFY